MTDYTTLSQSEVSELAEKELYEKLKIFIGENNDLTAQQRITAFVEGLYNNLADHIELKDGHAVAKTAWGESCLRGILQAATSLTRYKYENIHQEQLVQSMNKDSGDTDERNTQGQPE